MNGHMTNAVVGGLTGEPLVSVNSVFWTSFEIKDGQKGLMMNFHVYYIIERNTLL